MEPTAFCLALDIRITVVGAALLRLMQADIDQTSKEAIAGGNLKRILGGEVQL